MHRRAPWPPPFPYPTLFRSFASGSLVLTGPHEFIIDFVQTVSRPHRVAARVVLPVTIIPSVTWALKQNIETFTSQDRKSTRLNSSHGSISYAVFCLKKKKSK